MIADSLLIENVECHGIVTVLRDILDLSRILIDGEDLDFSLGKIANEG